MIRVDPLTGRELETPAARSRRQEAERAAAIAKLGWTPEPTYTAEQLKGVTPEERARRAGERYAATTGELVRWAAEVAS